MLNERDIPASVANDFADVEKFLPGSGLLITYVAGPYPDADQCRAIRDWLEAGGRWLALHGTSGGRAQRVEGVRNRRTVKMEHHALLGSYFLTHPPVREIRVEVRDRDSPLTRGLGTSFVVEDEPYFIELQDPAATRILLTADYGPAATRRSSARCTLPNLAAGRRPHARARIFEGSRTGRGRLFCARPLPQPGDPRDPQPRPLRQDAAAFHGPWETEAFLTLLRNAIAWGVDR